MKTVSKIPTVFGVLLLLLGVGAGVFLINKEQIFKLGASPQISPKNVRITSIGSDSFNVSWVTDSNTKAFIKWGETANLGKTLDDTNQSTSTHLVTLSGLEAGRNYYFKINSNGSDFDNDGAPWNTQTLSQAVEDTERVSGSILNTDTSPASNVLIYIDTKDFGTFSTITSANGNWTLNIPSNANTKSAMLLSIYGDSGTNGITTAQVYLENANPVQPLTLGQTYDLRNSSKQQGDGNLNAIISLPTQASQSAQSRFDQTVKTTTTNKTVTIKNISEGETVFTNRPQITGEGPKNTTVTITLHSSEAITGTVVVPQSGVWNWTPPSGLSEGEHTITLSWKDSSGILRTLTKTFVVEVNAAEPSFVSTPSGATPVATKTPSPTPTATASVSATPMVTPTPKITIKPTATATPATSSGLPNAGSSTFTLSLFIFGGLLILGGLFISKKSI